MVGGVPSPQPTEFEVGGRDLYSVQGAVRTLISTEGKPVFLRKVLEQDGTTTEAFASHRVNGSTLDRTVYWKPAGGPMKVAFTEHYDFKAGTIADSGDRRDFCHANGR